MRWRCRHIAAASIITRDHINMRVASTLEQEHRHVLLARGRTSALAAVAQGLLSWNIFAG